MALITSRIDDEYLERAGPQLRIVANYGVGVDNIDLAAAARRGIVVTNTPDVLTETTAELAIALTLSLLRRVTEGDRFLRAGRTWGFGLEFMLGEGLAGSALRWSGQGASAARRHASQRRSAPSRCWSGAASLHRALTGADIVSIALPPYAGDEAPDRRSGAGAPSAERRPREHGARRDRRRARRRRERFATGGSPALRSTFSSTSRR